MRHTLQLLVLVLSASVALGQDLMISISGGEERNQAMFADAKLYAETHLPVPENLGPGWKRPWELNVLGLTQGETQFWKGLRSPGGDTPLWHWFYGTTGPEALEIIREGIPEMESEMALDPQTASMGYLGTVEGRLHTQMAFARLHNSVPIYSEPIASLRIAPLLESGLAMADARTMEQVKEGLAFMRDVFAPEFEGADRQRILKAITREATMVRKFTAMNYIHLAEGSLLDEAKQVPKYGLFKVTIHVFRRDAIGRELVDVKPEDLPLLQKDYEAHLNGLASKYYPSANATYRVKWEQADYGDSSWVMETATTATGAGIPWFAAMHARIRNGNAVVNVKAEGTYSAKFLAKELDYVLAVLDEATAKYAEEEWE